MLFTGVINNLIKDIDRFQAIIDAKETTQNNGNFNMYFEVLSKQENLRVTLPLMQSVEIESVISKVQDKEKES